MYVYFIVLFLAQVAVRQAFNLRYRGTFTNPDSKSVVYKG